MLSLLVITFFLGAHGASGATNVTTADYPSETHNVTTEDGYILGLYRIPYGVNNSVAEEDRKVVFLMHGVTFGSNSFTYAGPEYALAYILADAGFDVWMGNARGNAFSRRHVTLDPDTDSRQFYSFSYEEIALYDVPASIDYILDTTGKQTLHYIGYSQGGSVYYALNSRSSAYQSKIASAHLLSGIGYQYNLPNTNMKLVSVGVDVIYSALLLSNNVEIAYSETTLAAVEILVGAKTPSAFIAGAGTKQLLHYVQNMRDKSFRSWDYGSVGNVEKYGSIAPPEYDLSNIHIPTTVHYSHGDLTQSEEDALAMTHAMRNATARKMPSETLSHIDYLTSKDAKELYIDYIIESLNKF